MSGKGHEVHIFACVILTSYIKNHGNWALLEKNILLNFGSQQNDKCNSCKSTWHNKLNFLKSFSQTRFFFFFFENGNGIFSLWLQPFAQYINKGCLDGWVTYIAVPSWIHWDVISSLLNLLTKIFIETKIYSFYVISLCHATVFARHLLFTQVTKQNVAWYRFS